MTKKNKNKLVIINTHPIQYFAPLYSELASRWDESFCVVYASKRGIVEAIDHDFSSSFKWEIDLLNGYNSIFIDEANDNASIASSSLRCDSLFGVLDRLSPEAVLIHGYYDPVSRTALKWAKKNRCKIFLRGDTWSGPGERTGWLRRRIKRFWLNYSLVGNVTAFLAVGKRNADYWYELGAKKSQVKIVPYAIDSEKFKPLLKMDERNNIRKHYGVSPNAKVIGYLGKFVEKKGVDKLLAALKSAGSLSVGTELLLVGDGPLRDEIAAIIIDFPVKVHVLGFRNQDEMPDLYRVCDLIVVPSLRNETWGFVVQEALACGVPVLASNVVGCVPDLIRSGINGYVLPVEDWAKWVTFIREWSDEIKDFDVGVLRKNPKKNYDFRKATIELAKILDDLIC